MYVSICNILIHVIPRQMLSKHKSRNRFFNFKEIRYDDAKIMMKLAFDRIVWLIVNVDGLSVEHNFKTHKAINFFNINSKFRIACSSYSGVHCAI